MSKFDTVWDRVTKVISFLLGSGIGVYETVVDKSDRPYLLAFAAGLIGPPLARSLQAGLEKLRTNAPADTPEKRRKR